MMSDVRLRYSIYLLNFILRFDFVSFLLAWHSRSKFHSAHASIARYRHNIKQAFCIWINENALLFGYEENANIWITQEILAFLCILFGVFEVFYSIFLIIFTLFF